MITRFTELTDRLRSFSDKRRIAVVAAHDEHTIEALAQAWRDGLVKPVLLGDAEKISVLLRQNNCPAGDAEIISVDDADMAARIAAEMVKRGEVNCIMKGKIETGTIMKVLVNRETGIRRRETMSLLAFIESPYYHKIFSITDVGLLTYPSTQQKQQAIENAVEAYKALRMKEPPKVAMLAAVEKVNPKMPETVEAEELKQKAVSGEINGCIIEGPISYDLAMEKESARIKDYSSPVAGDADILVVPNITVGNILIKSLICTGGARACGIVLGALAPLIITSRSSSTDDKYMSIVLAALTGSAGGY
jgi:phosphotransacetylase